MKRQPKQYDDDDGRTIVDMDIVGMKWHDRSIKQEPRAEKSQNHSVRGDGLTKSQARRFTWYAVLAGLTIVAVYAVVWGLLLLFATQVWFK
jgi:hypothetical protein